MQRGRKNRQGTMEDVCWIVQTCRLENLRGEFQRQVWCGQPPMGPAIFLYVRFRPPNVVARPAAGVNPFLTVPHSSTALHPMIRRHGSRCERHPLPCWFPFLICISNARTGYCGSRLVEPQISSTLPRRSRVARDSVTPNSKSPLIARSRVMISTTATPSAVTCPSPHSAKAKLPLMPVTSAVAPPSATWPAA